jgi:transcriptional regulator with XRE-family HTH domain
LNRVEKRKANDRLRELLKEARQKSGLKQTEIAKALGKPQSYISKCESGERKIEAVMLQEFAKVYGVPCSFFQVL